MKTTRKEREVCNAFYQSFLLGKVVDWFKFDEDDIYDIQIAINDHETKAAFDLMIKYLDGRGIKTLLSPKLWNDHMFLELYHYSGQALEKCTSPPILEELEVYENEIISAPEWFDSLEPESPMMRIRKR